MQLKSFFSAGYLWLFLAVLPGVISAGNGDGKTRQFPRGTHEVYIDQAEDVRTDLLKNIAPVIEKSIAQGQYPGAVILIGHQGRILYRGVFGSRRILPDPAPMRFDTIFDLASLTKVVATAPAVMQLVEQGKLDIDAPVAKYWPEFAKKGKGSVTIRELLTHTSGLPPEISHLSGHASERETLAQVTTLSLQHAPGKSFVYSDVNFIVLAYLVEVISGQRFDVYVQENIFKPLGMQHTRYLPPENLRDQIAPTEVVDKKLRWGQVHDPAAYALGGVAGNAGVFSDAHDLGIYAQALLNGGKLPREYHFGSKRIKYFLGPLAVFKMTTRQTPETLLDSRGLGWDIDSRYSNRGVLFPVNSYGHTGWTGTSIWIDPVTQTWMVMLTSRAHPVPAKTNQLVSDRRTIANILSASFVNITQIGLNNTGKGELSRAYKNV
ncbi:Esterase EstB [Aquicella siphonis]|uniref:Esterase EstB n=2 Tax=Aquicella siphonis TaxID=254247 RepID=A0A5E4PFB8_9COXI|nr:Esterase EstB [Aquicella siphonis]